MGLLVGRFYHGEIHLRANEIFCTVINCSQIAHHYPCPDREMLNDLLKVTQKA